MFVNSVGILKIYYIKGFCKMTTASVGLYSKCGDGAGFEADLIHKF